MIHFGKGKFLYIIYLLPARVWQSSMGQENLGAMLTLSMAFQRLDFPGCLPWIKSLTLSSYDARTLNTVSDIIIICQRVYKVNFTPSMSMSAATAS